jgi:hypothetical protein
MHIYKIRSWACGYTKFPWVAGWGPLEDMPFFDTFPPATQELKRRSWEVSSLQPGLYIDPGGKVWSDILGCGGGPPSFFVSERIVSDLSAEGIEFLRATEMPIAENGSKVLKNIPAPIYYVLEAEPGINFISEPKNIINVEMGMPKLGNRVRRPSKQIYLSSTWNGKDLFGQRNVYDSTTSLFCTDKVKNIAKRNGWTNIEFKAVEVIEE